jgi:hypothetical protein
MNLKSVGTIAGIGLAFAASFASVLLGLGSAVTTGRGLEVPDRLASWLLLFTTVAGFAVMSLITLVAIWFIVERGGRHLEKVKNGQAAYVPFIVIGVAVLVGAATRALANDPIVATVFGAVAAVISLGAARVIQTHPIMGIGLYFAAPVSTLLVLTATGALDVVGWLMALSVRDRLLVASLAEIVVVLPAIVAAVERYKQSEPWQFGARLDRWLRSHRALALLTRKSAGPATPR